MRISNLNKVIVGHINVNYFPDKLDTIKIIIPSNIDIMILLRPNLMLHTQLLNLLLKDFQTLRLDINSNGGGLLIYVREDIPCKQMYNH